MNEHNNLQPGDVVVLNSGGPSMTVEELVVEGRVLCAWFMSSEVQFGDGTVQTQYHGDPLVHAFVSTSVTRVK